VDRWSGSRRCDSELAVWYAPIRSAAESRISGVLGLLELSGAVQRLVGCTARRTDVSSVCRRGVREMVDRRAYVHLHSQTH
jgi:hypothetical protein